MPELHQKLIAKQLSHIKMSSRNYDAPSGEVRDDSYATDKSGPVPVQSDNAKVEDPIDENVADSDAQLGKSSLHREYSC